MKQWQIIALAPFPMETVDSNGMPISGSFPQTLHWKSRIIQSRIEVDGVHYFLRSMLKPEFRSPENVFIDGKKTELVEIIFQVPTETIDDALNRAEPLLENVCDALAFQAQVAIKICQLEIIDFTPPVALGEKRDVRIYPYPTGYEHTKFQKSGFVMTVTTVRDIAIGALPLDVGPKLRGAIRWYHKALSASADIDKFLWLFVTLELLCQVDDTPIKKPYMAPCQHEITACPKCAKPTDKPVWGETIRVYLTDKLEVDLDTAKELWKVRQVIHGTNLMTPQQNESLAINCLKLQAAVNLGIKLALGTPQQGPPYVSSKGTAVSHLSVNRNRALFNEDFI